MSDFIAACDGGDLAEVRRRLAAGADPSTVKPSGWSVLCAAINIQGNAAHYHCRRRQQHVCEYHGPLPSSPAPSQHGPLENQGMGLSRIDGK